MALNAELLRSSLEVVLDRQPDLTQHFYRLLFARHPELEPLFDPARMKRQEEMLGSALVAVIDHVEDAGWLTEHLGNLGAKHVDYGVTAPMYEKVAGTLLVAMAEAAGPAWTAELEGAWGDALGAVRDLMLAGAARTEAAAAS